MPEETIVSHVLSETEKARDALMARKRALYGRLVKIERDLEAPVNADAQERATERENDEVLEGLGHAGETEIRAIDAASTASPPAPTAFARPVAHPSRRSGWRPCRTRRSARIAPPTAEAGGGS